MKILKGYLRNGLENLLNYFNYYLILIDSFLFVYLQLEYVTIVGVSLLVKSILNVFGRNKLKGLTLEFCQDIEMMDLLFFS